MDLTLVGLITIAIIALYYYLTKNYNYWEKRGIPSVPGPIIGIGHMLPVLFVRINMPNLLNKFYHKFKRYSMFGYYDMRKPVLVVREPELVKQVLQTSFSSFHENMFQVDPTLDPLLAKNPFFCDGDVWMTGRKRLTYAFSNMRLKILSESVQKVCKKFENYLNEKLATNDKVDLELKDLFSKFTGEVVANAGFGVEGFCFQDKPRPDSFVQIGKSLFEPSFMTGLVQIITFFMPFIGKIFRISFIPKNIDNFFRSIVKQILETRRNESVQRNDFFQLMADLEKTEGTKVDEETLASHGLSFFVDGFETSSVTLSFIGFHLAQHKDVQDKLRAEVKSVLAKHGGAITYEAVKEMTYMNQVISESQRLAPALGNLSKKCTANVELKGSDGLACTVEKGTIVMIPLEGIQNDPNFWTNPEAFDPDRFGDERKSSILKYAFLPFGEGPRICVGMRMALLQMKSCIASLLNNYEIEVSPKTQLPLKWHPHHFLRAAIGGLWIYVKPLQKTL